MKDLQQHQTMKSTQKKESLFRSGAQHYAWSGSTVPELVGKQFGQVIVISSKLKRMPAGKTRNGGKLYKHLYCQCKTCHRKSWINYSNLLSGRSAGCQHCTRTYSKFQQILGAKYDAIVLRCTNPKNPQYPDYGGRGIQNQFQCRKEFVLYVEKNLPHPDYKGIEIDRKNNNGHYAPGNLRLATRAEQNRNKRNNRWMDYKGEKIVCMDLYDRLKADYPEFSLGRRHTERLAYLGIPWLMILERKGRGPYKKRGSMTS